MLYIATQFPPNQFDTYLFCSLVIQNKAIISIEYGSYYRKVCYCEAHLTEEMAEEIEQCKELTGEIENLQEFCEEHSRYANLYKQSNMLSEAYKELDAICSRIYDALKKGEGNAFLYLFIENLIESAEILCIVQKTAKGLDRLLLAMELSTNQIEKAEASQVDEAYIEDFRLLYSRANDIYKSFFNKLEFPE